MSSQLSTLLNGIQFSAMSVLEGSATSYACKVLTDCLVMQYDADSAPAAALNATIARTEKRFATYAKQGLLCGTDGLPHLISDPGLAIRYGHTGETLVSFCHHIFPFQHRFVC